MGTIKKLAKKGRKTARKAYDKLETKVMAAAYKRALRRKVKELGAVSREVVKAAAIAGGVAAAGVVAQKIMRRRKRMRG